MFDLKMGIFLSASVLNSLNMAILRFGKGFEETAIILFLSNIAVLYLIFRQIRAVIFAYILFIIIIIAIQIYPITGFVPGGITFHAFISIILNLICVAALIGILRTLISTHRAQESEINPDTWG